MLKSTENTNNLITALYCRLSQEDERMGESLSIENQKIILRKYADDHGFHNCKFYVDDGYSGTDFTRPAHVQMIKDVEAGKIGVIIVKDQSRLGRDYLETGHLMDIKFPSYDVRFIAINDGYDSINRTDNDFSGMRNYFNDYYAADTSRKIRAVQRSKGQRGERVSSATPYGYMRNPENKKELIPDPQTAPIVKRIFEMCASGLGVVKICDTLCAEKILAPSVYIFRTTGKRIGNPDLDRPYHWAQTTVRKMLENQEYVGDTVNFKTYSKSNKLKKRLKNDPDKILIFRNTHEAIVEREVFERVQMHFAGRKRPDKQGEVDKYAGILYCGDCQKRLYLARAKTLAPEKNAFQCGGYRRRTTDCTAHNIREMVLDQIVLDDLKRMTAFARDEPDKFYEAAMQKAKDEAEKFYAIAKKQKSKIEERIKKISGIIRCLYEDRVVGRISVERYDELACGYEQEQAELKQELESLTKGIAEMDAYEQAVREFTIKAQQYVEMPKLTSELLRTFIRKIEVFEKPEKYSRTCGNPVVIYYKFQMRKLETLSVMFGAYEEDAENSIPA